MRRASDLGGVLQLVLDGRQQRLQRYNLDGVMDDILQKLEHIKELEREGIYQRMEQAGLEPPRTEPDESGESGAWCSRAARPMHSPLHRTRRRWRQRRSSHQETSAGWRARQAAAT